MNNKAWLLTFAAVTLAAGIGVCSVTAYIDPYMHFHKPLTDKYYYDLGNQRSQNDGITKNFDYDALITGTSMTENFRTTEVDRIFGCNSIKVSYSGGSFKEINDNLTIALREHPDIKYIIRGLDQSKFIEDKNWMRNDLGKYPTYLYDSNPFNDVDYLMNRDVLYTRVWNMVEYARHGNPGGITSFDDYSNWMSAYTFGQQAVLKDVFSDEGEDRFQDTEQTATLTDAEKERIKENIEQNVTNLADRYPNTTFYYFLTPYSAAFWGEQKQDGTLEKQIEIEKYAISLIVSHHNIHLFGWNRFDLLDDLNNYKDAPHYGEWINSWMLSQMHKESGRLTSENYEAFITELHDHYIDFDYNSLFDQTDNEADYYISGLLNKEISGTEPFPIDEKFLANTEIKNANIIHDQYEGTDGLECHGAMVRDSIPDSAESAMLNGDYCGIKFQVDVSDYRALTFYGKKVADHGRPTVCVYDEDGKLLREVAVNYPDIDTEWHQYAVNLDGIYGNATIIMNGGYTDNSGSDDSDYIFSKIVIY